MILYNSKHTENMRKRPIKVLNIDIEEKPERPIYVFRNERERVKFIKMCESIIRKSMEYKEYIKFLKQNMDMNKCIVLKGLNIENGKRYSIEIHHEPFTLFDIVETVISKREENDESINPFFIADEVMELHYDEKVGLVPLAKTMHQLVSDDKIFIPLQLIYHKYDKFYEEYEMYMSQRLKEKIDLKVSLSLKCGNILSDVLDPEFTYINIDGFDFPEVPDEWANALKSLNDIEV